MEGEQAPLEKQEPSGITNEEVIQKVSFWEIYPDADKVTVIRELKTKRGDRKSSDVMWYIHCMLDPENKFMQHLPFPERKAELQKYYSITNKDINSETFKKVVAWYKEYWMSAARRMLNSLRKKLFESEKLIDNHELKTADDIMYFGEMQKAFKMFKDAHDEAEASFKAEGPTKRKLGGEPLSAADDGSLFDLL